MIRKGRGFRNCIVPGCKDETSTRHKFPCKRLDTFRTWVVRINNPLYKHLSKDTITNRYRVCGRHFEENCKIRRPNQSERIFTGSLPTLHLPNYPQDLNLTLTDIWPGGMDEKIDLIVTSNRQLVENVDKLLSLDSSCPNTVPMSSPPHLSEDAVFLAEDDFFKESKKDDFLEILCRKSLRELIPIDRPSLCTKPNGSMYAIALDEAGSYLIVDDSPEGETFAENSINNNCIEASPTETSQQVIEIDSSSDQDAECEPTVNFVDENSDLRNDDAEEVGIQQDEDIENTAYGRDDLKPDEIHLDGINPKFSCKQSTILENILSGKSIGDVCRICLRLFHPEDLTKQSDQITYMLKMALPDLDLNIYPDNTYCQSCLELLTSSYKLKEIWLKAEQKLQMIMQKKEEYDINEITTIEQDVLILDHCYNKPLRQLGTRRMRFGPGPYLCHLCGVRLDKIHSFAGHLRRHKTHKPSKKEKRECNICYQVLFTSLGFRKHLQKHAESKPEPGTYPCTQCTKVLTNKFSLKLHIRRQHLKLYDYGQCHVCGIRLRHRANMRQHLLIHSGIRAHECNICHKKFKTVAHLQHHALRHSDIHYTCGYCGKRLKYKHTLQVHIEIYHQDGGKFKCEICGRGMSSKFHLNRHRIRIHGATTYTQNSKNQLSNETDEGNSIDELISLDQIELC